MGKALKDVNKKLNYTYKNEKAFINKIKYTEAVKIEGLCLKMMA